MLKTLQKHHLTLNDTQVSRLSCLAAKLPESYLGLSPQTYGDLAHSAKLVIHAAWPVHFGAGLQSFVPHLQGLHNLIQLARTNEAKFFFCSSTSSVLAGPSRHIEERIYTDPENAVAIGYARSKFVAESICASAWQAGGQGQIGVLRLGQLSGDTQHGIWKTEEGWPQLFASADFVGCLPDLDEVCQISRHRKTAPILILRLPFQTLNWLPMDKAAQAITDIATSPSHKQKNVPVYHVTSISHSTTYRDALSVAKKAGLRFEIVPPAMWLKKLQEARDAGKQHSSLKMLATWERNVSLEACLIACRF